MPVSENTPPEWEKCMDKIADEQPELSDEQRAKICWDAIKKTHYKDKNGKWVKKEEKRLDDRRIERLEQNIIAKFQDGVHKPVISDEERQGGYRKIKVLALKPGVFNRVRYERPVLIEGADSWTKGQGEKGSWFMLNHSSDVKDRAGPILKSYYDKEADGVVHEGILTNRRAIEYYDDGLLTTTSVELIVGVDMEKSEPEELVASWIKGTDNCFVHNPACKECGVDKFEEIVSTLQEEREVLNNLEFRVNRELIKYLEKNMASIGLEEEEKLKCDDMVSISTKKDEDGYKLKYLFKSKSSDKNSKIYYKYPIIKDNKVYLKNIMDADQTILNENDKDSIKYLNKLENIIETLKKEEDEEMDEKTFNEKVKDVLMSIGLLQDKEKATQPVSSGKSLEDEEQIKTKKEELKVVDEETKTQKPEINEAENNDRIQELEQRLEAIEKQYLEEKKLKEQLMEERLLDSIIDRTNVLDIKLTKEELLKELEDIDNPELRIKTLKAIDKGYEKALSKIPEGMLPQVANDKIMPQTIENEDYTDEELEETEKKLYNAFIG